MASISWKVMILIHLPCLTITMLALKAAYCCLSDLWCFYWNYRSFHVQSAHVQFQCSVMQLWGPMNLWCFYWNCRSWTSLYWYWTSQCPVIVHFWYIFICFVIIQVIAIAMDIFTDVDIFKEVVDASIRGVPVYILLDHIHFKSFLAMTANLDIQIQKLRVSHLSFLPTLHCALII